MREVSWNTDEAWRFKLVAGHSGLDFLNTADWHASDRPVERLSSYATFVDWCRQAGLIGAETAASLTAGGQRRREHAGAVLVEAVAMREAAFRVLSNRSEDSQEDLAVVNRTLHSRAAACRITLFGRRFWEPVYADDLGAVLGPVSLHLSTVLVGTHLDRVKECEAPGCGWLYLDSSRSGKRRWCSMAECGNRNKVRQHYQRSRFAAKSRDVLKNQRSSARPD
jgi:predicted RNA-binding Zn ribbon-like protein